MSFGIQAIKYSYIYAVSPIEKHLCDFKNICPEYKMRQLHGHYSVERGRRLALISN